jgi:uncharacterized protein YukE
VKKFLFYTLIPLLFFLILSPIFADETSQQEVNIEELVKQIEELQILISEKPSVDEVISIIDEKIPDISGIETAIQDIEGRLSDIEEVIGEKVSLDEVENLIGEKLNELSSVLESKANLEDLKKIEDEMASLNKRFSEIIPPDVKDFADMLSIYREDLKTMDKNINAVFTILGNFLTFEGRVDTIEEDILKSQKFLEDLDVRVEDLEITALERVTREEFETTVDEIERNIEEINNKISTLREDLENTKNETNTQFQEVRTFSNALENRISKLENEKQYLETQVKFFTQRKDPWTAVMFSLLVPSLGHTYAGDRNKGLIFLGVEGLELGLTIWGLSSQNTTVTYIGALLLLGTRLYECYSAYTTAENYNKKLKVDLKLTSDDELRFSLSYNF